MAENAVLIRRWFEEVWNQGREQTIDDLCAKDATGFGQAEHGAQIYGSEHFKTFWRGFRAAFSDIHVEIHDTIEQADTAVARWTMTMKHTATFLGIPATAKSATVNGISIQRYANGKIITGWDNWDQLGLLVQLGAVPPAKFM